MKCINCGKKIIIQRTINNLFKNEKKYLCNECNKRKIAIKIERIIVENKDVYIYIVGDDYFNQLKYFEDYNYTVEYLLKKNEILLLFDVFRLNDKTNNLIKLHQMINDDKNINVICFCMQN